MSRLTKWMELLVNTSTFTGLCAVGLCVATESLIRPDSAIEIGTHLHQLILGGTMAVYNLPRLVPRPYGKQRGPQPLRKWYIASLVVGLMLLTNGIVHLPRQATEFSAALGFLAIAYFLPTLPFGNKRRLRDFGLLKIFVLTAVWTGVTAVLPMLVNKVNPSSYPVELVIRFLLVFALCVLFDIRDIKIDLANNIRTLPQRIGKTSAYGLVYTSLGAMVISGVMQYARHPDWGRLAATVLTAIVTAVVTELVKRQPKHSAFVAMTDGMMLLYGLLVIIATHH